MSNELQRIDFHGDEVFALKDEYTGEIYVSVREICNSLGLNFSGQYTKLTTDPVYNESLRYISIQTPGGKQVALSIPSVLLQGWLFSIQTNRLKPEIREKHVQYKRECLQVLNDYFTKGIAINPRADALRTLTDRVDKIELKLSQKVPSLRQAKHDKVRTGVLEAVSNGEKSTNQLYDFFSRNINARTLHAVLNQLIQENLICTRVHFGLGRPATLYQPKLTIIGK